jgi:integrase
MPTPWFVKKKRLWVCKYRRKRIYLCAGKNTKKDYERACEIMLKKCPAFLDVRLGEYQKLPLYAEFYLERTQSRSFNGNRVREQIVNGFVERWKKMDVSDLLPLHLQTWLEEKDYGNNKWNAALATINAMFNWGVQQGLIVHSPVQGIRKKSPVYKTLDCVITEEEHARLLAVAKPEEARTLTALYETGCRPGELRILQKHHYYPKLRAWVFADDEAKVKGRKVYLSKKMVAMTEQLIAAGRDFLFRHPNTNKPWDDPTGNGMAMWFRRLRQKAGIDRSELTAYGYRHRFATNLILKDVHLAKIAELMGHSNTRTLERWYIHLRDNDKALTDVLDAVSA